MPSFHVRILETQDPDVARAESSLDAEGFAIPLPSRQRWGRLLGGRFHRHALAVDAAGRFGATVGFSITPTRALPGHRVLRLEAVGEAYASPAGLALIAHAAEYARSNSRILRAVVELECRDASAREMLRSRLAQTGFAPGVAERVAPTTLELDLTPDEPELFAALSKSTRQNVRTAGKSGLVVERLLDPALGVRMNELLTASFARTGSRTAPVDWAAIMTLSAELPHRSSLLGAFLQRPPGPPELVAFAWCLHHGDRAEYSHGASARLPGVTLRLLTPVLWESVRWAKREGAPWFDFGGVTQGSSGSGDALGGISDFKRGFSKNVIDFGEEWVYEPRPARARLARLASATMQRIRQYRS